MKPAPPPPPDPPKVNVFMPLYWGDFFSDTMMLSTLEIGAYTLLIGAYWQQGRALPDDDGRLSRLARLSESEWSAVRPVLKPYFVVADGVWFHKRIEEELAKARSLVLSQREKARVGAEKRRARPSPGSAGGQPQLSPGAAVAQPQPSQSHSHSESHSSSDAEAHALSGVRAPSAPISAPLSTLNPELSTVPKRLHGLPSSVDEVIAFGRTLRPPKSEADCREFWAYYEGQARQNPSGETFWVTRSDAVVTNWRAKLPTFGGLNANKPTQSQQRTRSTRNTGTLNESRVSDYAKHSKVLSSIHHVR